LGAVVVALPGCIIVTQQSSQPQKTVSAIMFMLEVADDHAGLEQGVPVIGWPAARDDRHPPE
jgi:hypothetical protein